MKRWIFCGVCLAVWLVGVAHGQALQYGMTPEEVLEELGRPRSTMSAGGRDIWMYDADGRVVFSEGKVSAIQHLPVDGVNGAKRRSVALSEQSEAEAAAEAQAAEEAALEAELEREREASEAEMAKLREEFESETEAFLNGELGAEDESDWELSPGQEALYLGVEIVVGLVVMVVILKLAFAWSDIHGDWGQMFFPAFVAVAIKVVVRFTAQKMWGVTDVFYVDHGLSYLGLLVVLMKFTHASSWQRAVAVAGAAKLASIVVWVLLSVVLLNLLFG
ncbi:hypothetical protein [Actomonas aquatica]|uniref:Uncharacterized protein n=1 Tax=Actomonas aquatica TaxID=2866162 RepID=A0ABZ1CE75_9BACT|nr:hypothetical protein [Opitutus sp. WL0086]WRQ89717.1 hypothetical protein K1X11_009885 [Opitutus sp. WL0086]